MNLSNKNKYKFGIFQSSEVSCIFYKEDQDGNQSTFNLFILPDIKQNKLFTYIDNIKLDKKVWHSDNNNIEDIIKSFNEWSSEAPVLFELEAQKSLSNCLNNFMTNNEI